jgi:PAS domain S-box-containing protein
MSADQRSVLELLYRVSREFATALDLRMVLQRVLFAAIENVGGERGSVVVLDDNGRAVDSAFVYGNRLHESATIQLRDTVERGLAGWVVRNREAALVPDTSKDERWLRREDDAIDRSGAKSAICVPLLAREKLVGVLTLVHPVPKAYNDEHLELMQAIADQAGVSVLNARLYAESQRQARVMTALAEGAASMNASLRVEEAFERVLSQARQAMQVDTATLALVEASGEMVFRAALGEGSEKIKGRRIRSKGGVAGMVAREGRGVIVPTVTNETLLSDAEQSLGKVRALACAPIHAQGKVIGVLEVFNPSTKGFDPDALLVLAGLGSLAGTVIQNAQLFERLDSTRRRYSDLFETSIDPIVITDLQGRIQEANHQASLLSGYQSQELREFLVEQVHEVNFDKTGRLFENIGETALIYESTLFDKQGGKRPVEVYARKVIFDEAEAIQWILRDITERKDLDALREDLAAMIYHDLRSPLANIVSSVEMLGGFIRDDDQENAHAILKIAHHSIARIQRLIASLLDLNRLEQNHPVGERQAVTVQNLVDETVEAVRPAAEGRFQKIVCKVEPGMPMVNVDVDMIRRVLINLTENAIKYTPADGIIEIGAVPEVKDFVRIWVEDNGPGIPEVDRERIFDKFTRLKKSGQGGPSGLGVGLAFCKLAVRGHGGSIWVEPALDKGSRFSFTLPLAQET